MGDGIGTPGSLKAAYDFALLRTEPFSGARSPWVTGFNNAAQGNTPAVAANTLQYAAAAPAARNF